MRVSSPKSAKVLKKPNHQGNPVEDSAAQMQLLGSKKDLITLPLEHDKTSHQYPKMRCCCTRSCHQKIEDVYDVNGTC